MPRRTDRTLRADLADHVERALSERLGPVQLADDAGIDLIVDIDGRHLLVELKVVAYATEQRLASLLNDLPDTQNRIVLVAADRINGPARAALDAAGLSYFDVATGALHVRAPGVRVDSVMETPADDPHRRPTGIVGRAGHAVAYELLRRYFDSDDRPIRTSRSLEEFDVARSTTSDAMRALVAADLVVRGQPVVPELFWELAKQWSPPGRRWLAARPSAEDAADTRSRPRVSWRVGGVLAATVHGAPAVGTADDTIDLYVPTPTLVTTMTRKYGSADPIAAAASIAVPSAAQVTGPPESGGLSYNGWPVVHPVAAALDLAALADARSDQILREWRPTTGRSVWHD